MELETKRLKLVPYTLEQMYVALRDPLSAAALIGATSVRPGFFTRIRVSGIYTAKIRIMERFPDAWLLSTYWQLVLKNDMRIIGEAGFKGPPVSGEIEIGYGLQKPFRHRGYMTEAVERLCEFAFYQSRYKVDRILAGTRKNNTASQNVLMRCGFKCTDNSSNIYLWHKYKA